jgi:hypothetical protein
MKQLLDIYSAGIQLDQSFEGILKDLSHFLEETVSDDCTSAP